MAAEEEDVLGTIIIMEITTMGAVATLADHPAEGDLVLHLLEDTLQVATRLAASPGHPLQPLSATDKGHLSGTGILLMTLIPTSSGLLHRQLQATLCKAAAQVLLL